MGSPWSLAPALESKPLVGLYDEEKGMQTKQSVRDG